MHFSLEELNGHLQDYYQQHANALNTVQQVTGAIMAIESQIKALISKQQQQQDGIEATAHEQVED